MLRQGEHIVANVFLTDGTPERTYYTIQCPPRHRDGGASPNLHGLPAIHHRRSVIRVLLYHSLYILGHGAVHRVALSCFPLTQVFG